MAPERSQDSRRATAERNRESILDAAEELLEAGREPSISAVAAAAGVSRVTVYSHYADRRQLLESLVERAVERAVGALASAEPERGPPDAALARVVAASWERLARNEAIARASAAQLSPEAMRRAHAGVRAVLAELIERGRREGTFRTDLPVPWLVTASLALIHGGADEVRAGLVDAGAQRDYLTLTIGDLVAGEPRARS